EQEYERAQTRLREIETELARLTSDGKIRRSAVDAETVAAAIEHLADILAGQNPSAANLLLSQHIDQIACGPDGSVMIRTCKLGALAGSLDLVISRGETDTGNAV